MSVYFLYILYICPLGSPNLKFKRMMYQFYNSIKTTRKFASFDINLTLKYMGLIKRDICHFFSLSPFTAKMFIRSLHSIYYQSIYYLQNVKISKNEIKEMLSSILGIEEQILDKSHKYGFIVMSRYSLKKDILFLFAKNAIKFENKKGRLYISSSRVPDNIAYRTSEYGITNQRGDPSSHLLNIIDEIEQKDSSYNNVHKKCLKLFLKKYEWNNHKSELYNNQIYSLRELKNVLMDGNNDKLTNIPTSVQKTMLCLISDY